jgi:putative aldouronate transport system permease protein
MLIQRGAVGPGASEVLTTFSYEFGIVNGNYSYGAAAGLFLGVTSLVLILAANKVAHLFGEDGLYRR